MLIRLKIYIILFLNSLVFCSVTYSQNYFTSNFYNNAVFNNPSLASINENSLLQMNYRNQWPVDGLFNTYGGAFFHAMSSLNSNVGVVLNHDRQYKGFLTNTTVGVNYSYKIKIAYRNYLSFGLNGSYNLRSLDYSNLHFENPGVVYLQSEQNHYPIINAGMTLTFQKDHNIGVSIVNIYPFLDQPIMNRALCLSYLSHIESNRYNTLPGYIEPMAEVYITEDFLRYNYGINLGFYNIKSGILISQTGLNVNSIALLLGILFDNYEFIYAYDLNLSSAVSINPKMTAHEVTFLYKLQYKGRRKKMGAIKCPKI
ncbi:MAG: PorP/SprF family type IX secretion system membrane protein [Bacteroidales bacterium]|nr:PorP/SprF family type IX secretion system membrane protein [Bacteroidales bacterium]MBN2819419.1 PorP/SprF family type IX secretion system membrane protein [Bacteroidales bacterium]